MCGDGWFDLIDVLCAEITRYADDAGLDVVLSQVKEKFGALRFYLRGGNEYIHGLVWMAGALSKGICEECGKPGWMSESGWIKVRCAEHGGQPPQGGNEPGVVSYVIGAERTRIVGDSALIITGAPRPEPLFHLPEIETERWKPLAERLEKTLDTDIRRNGMPMIEIENVIETETLAFRWRGGDDKGRAQPFFRLVEALSQRV